MSQKLFNKWPVRAVKKHNIELKTLITKKKNHTFVSDKSNFRFT